MKEGWTYKKLGEVCEILNGFAFQSKNYVPEGIRVVRITNVQKGYIEDVDPKYYPIESKNELSRYLLKDGDLLLSLTGNVGRVAIIDCSYLPAYLNQRVACIRVKENVSLDLNFLFHLLYSKKFEGDCIKSSKGAAQLNMSTIWLASYLIPVPSIEEQRSIVARLDAAFAHIDALKANADKQLAEARQLFQAELAECMRHKEGWEEKMLGDMCLKITDGTHNSPPNSSIGNYKYVTAKNIKTWGLDLSNITYVTEEIHKEIYARCNPEKGDVLYIKDGATIGIAIINPLDEEFSLLSSVALIKPIKEKLLSKFLCYALNSPAIYEQTRNQMDGAAITRVTLVKIKGFVIPVPPVTVQHQIVSRLDALSVNIKKLEEVQRKTLAECDALKQAMLREVFE